MSSQDSIISILRRVYSLLSRSERKRSALLLFTILINSIVEILGLAVIVPVIGLVVQPATIQTNPTLKTAFDLLSPVGINTPQRFLIILCLVMIGAFLFKALFGIAVNLFQTRYSFSVAHRLSGKMWTYHFSQSLERMRGNDSGRILTEINLWPLGFARAFLVGGLLILTELCVIALIATFLLFYNPIVFVSITSLSAIGVLIIRVVTKRRLSLYSEIQSQIEPRTNTLITNSIRGFLEVITFRASDAMRNAFLKDRWTIFRLSSNTIVLNQAPAKLYEVLAVTAVAGSIIISLLQGTPESGFLQLLSFMAISAYRIMPSLSRFNGAIMQMRAQLHQLDAMETSNINNVQQPLHNPSTRTESCEIDINLKGVTLSYETLDKPVIQDLEFSFNHGKFHGIIGPSGCGKSTLISSLLGLHKPEQGKIQIRIGSNDPINLGEEILLQNWVLNVGYLSQQPFLFKGSVKDNLTLNVPGTVIDEKLTDKLIHKLKLSNCLGPNPLTFQLQEGGSNLSGGQQQRLALLRALQLPRSVLILDEATSALDDELSDVVFGLLRERADSGCNVILVTHDTNLAARCDDILSLG